MVNLGALTTTFTPSASCSSLEGYTLSVIRDGTYYIAQGPLVTEGCYPSDYDPSSKYYYSPGICPSGYTAACSTVVAVGTSTDTIDTCCPTALSASWKCQGPVQEQWPWQSTLGCVHQFPSGSTVTLAPLTIVADETTSVIASSTFTFGGIGAYAIVVARTQATDATPTSAVSSANSVTSTSPPTASSGGHNGHVGGLSSGAMAGIGIGCGMAVLLLGASALLIWKKRRRPRLVEQSYASTNVNAAKPVSGVGEHRQETVGSPYFVAETAELHTPTEYGDTALTPRRHHEGPFELAQELPTR